MNRKKYNQIRVIITLFVSAVVILAVTNNSYLLSIAGVATGLVFMTFVRSKTQIRTDEREATIQEKAARMTYAIFAPTIGISALLMLIPSYSGLSVFAKGEFAYLESLGMVFAYLALFLIAIYAISYHFLNRKYGGGNNEK
ncbi:MAG: DUF2178 domain-containing protein [Patescibacteria group bacterium]